MSTKQSLQEMGFPDLKIETAISACGENLEQAMEWLLAHSEVPLPDSAAPVPASSDNADMAASEEHEMSETESKISDNSEAPSSEAKPEAPSSEAKPSEKEGEVKEGEKMETQEEDEAKSIKCDDCGKLFKSSEEIEFHAVKSGHSSFSESTEEKMPLTEEERRQKLKDLEDKLRVRRKEKEEEERKESIVREKKRIQMSREIAETKRRLADEEIRRVAEARRREKLEDKLAREKVKDQIQRDKEARKEIFGGANATPAAPVPAPQPVASSAPKTYDFTRLQMRLASGAPLVQEFKAKESLSAVRLWIELNRKDATTGLSPAFKLSTTFPRRVFTEEDMDKPLNVLGLVPSAVLVVMDT